MATNVFTRPTGNNGTLRITVVDKQNQSANSTTFTVTFDVVNTNPATFFANTSWSGNTAGTSRSGSFSVNGTGTYRLGQWTFTKAHTSAGNLANQSFSLTMGATGTFGLGGPTTVSGTVSIPRIPKVPGKPANVTNVVPGPTSVAFSGSAPDNGGSGITSYQYQLGGSSSFTTIYKSWSATIARQTATGLTPGIDHWIRYRARNAVGYGPWSNGVKTTTLNVNPPTLTVTPTADGTAALLTLGPPSTLPNPSGYRVNYVASTNSTGPGVTIDIPANATWPFTVTASITPGSTYIWKAAVLQGSYVSNYSDPITVTQPKPNLNPGDYFDGSFTSSTDYQYVWMGSPAHGVTSRMVGKAPVGFTAMRFITAPATSPHSGTYFSLLQESVAGNYVGRMLFLSSPGERNWGIGTDRVQVAAGGEYTGSIHARVEGQDIWLRLGIIWYDVADVMISYSFDNTARQFTDHDDWRRISFSAIAPAGAVKARVVLEDIGVGGQESDMWQPGSSLLFDRVQLQLGALTSYFDGSMRRDTYEYEWTGPAWQSASTATLVPESEREDHFADPDCEPIPVPPAPPAIVDECIIDVGQWRRYWLQIPASDVGKWTATIPSLTINSGAFAARQIRIRYYPNPDQLAPADFMAVEYESEQIISYMPPNATYELDGLTQHMRGTAVDLSDWRDLNHLLYGTGGSPASWPEMRCGVAYLIALDVPIDAPDGNLSTGIALTRRY